MPDSLQSNVRHPEDPHAARAAQTHPDPSGRAAGQACTGGPHQDAEGGRRPLQGDGVSLAGVGFLVSLTKERMMRYTIAVTSMITITGTMTVEAATPEEAKEQAEATLDQAWRHDPPDWQAGIDVLDDAQMEHEILCDVMLGLEEEEA